MNFKIKTRVDGHYMDVMRKFDRELFEYLLPKTATVELVEFTGSKTGDRVHLRFVKPFRASWISDIVDHGENSDSAFFTDVGVELPFGLKSWKHNHIVERDSDTASIIVDDISYSFGNKILDLLLFPALYLSFLPRQKLYRKYFNT